jgi:acetolactate synthase I/II/III large subunit
MPKMTGSRYFAEMMHGYGVTHIFFVPTMLLPALAAMEDMGIRRVMTHGEKAAAYMADGYARASHRPGICMAQAIGASNLAAGLRDAYMGGSPVIALTGGQDAASRYRHLYQEVEDFPMFEPVTHANMYLDALPRLPDTLRQAFRVATTAPGPVHIQMRGTHGQVLESEADLELLIEDAYRTYPPNRPAADSAAVHHAVRALMEAERPIIVAGSGVASSGAEAELVELAEKLNVPVATSLQAKASIAGDHPLSVGVPGTYSRWCANRSIAEADLVFFVGSHTGSQVTNNWKIPRPGTAVIQLDLDPAELGRNYPNMVSLQGDAKTVLRQMIDAHQPESSTAPPHSGWLERVHGYVLEYESEIELQRTSNTIPLRPERIMKEIGDALPDEAVVVVDTGHSGMWSAQALELTKPGQCFLRASGSLGWAFPASLGAKCALPNTPVICFTGDGGFYYHLAELETAARFGINAVIVVNNNASLNQETHLFNEAYGGQQRGRAREMWTFHPTNLVQVAEGLGVRGIRVEDPNDLADALREALSFDGPVVIDAISDIEAMAARAWG